MACSECPTLSTCTSSRVGCCQKMQLAVFMATWFGKDMAPSPWPRCFEAELFTLPVIWEELQKSANFAQRLADIQDYNKASPWRKRGIAMVPCR